MGVEMMRKTFKSSAVMLIAAMVVLLGNSQLSAAPLLPTGTQFPAVGEPEGVGGVQQPGSPLVSPFNVAGFFTGTLTSRVYAGDPSNPNGGLTFTYELTNAANSPNAISQIALNNFTAFLTDVSYSTLFAGWDPAEATRPGALGNTINFNYQLLPGAPGPLPPGQTSRLLVIQTNAPAFVVSNASIIDSGAISVPILGPAIPEPASLGLLSLAGGLVLRRRRSA